MTTILIALTLLTTGLAGCTGDPDGGGNDEIDSETLQGMIEAGLQDFMNNTSVEISANYYTNSTNQYNVNGSSMVGSSLHTMAGNAPGIPYAWGMSSVNLSIGVNMDAHLGATEARDINGASICLEIGSDVESVIATFFDYWGMYYTAVNSETEQDAFASFNAGECSAVVHSPDGPDNLLDNSSVPDFASFDIVSWGGLEWSNVYASNSLLLTINQDAGQTLDFLEFYAEVTLSGTCVTNCTNQDEDYSERSDTESFSYDSGHHRITAYCDYNLTLILYESPSPPSWPFSGGGISGESLTPPYPGLDCEIVIELSFWVYDGFQGADRYDWTWSDWTYHIHWASTPVTLHE